jgi:hypothetical protein
MLLEDLSNYRAMFDRASLSDSMERREKYYHYRSISGPECISKLTLPDSQKIGT